MRVDVFVSFNQTYVRKTMMNVAAACEGGNRASDKESQVYGADRDT